MAGSELTNVVAAGEGRAAARQARLPGAGAQFLAEGPQAVREALKLDGVTLELFATAEAELRHAELVADAPRKGVPSTWPAARSWPSSPDRHPAGPAGCLPVRATSRSTTSWPPRRAWSRSSRTSATPATPAPSCAPRTPRAPTPSSSPTPRSTLQRQVRARHGRQPVPPARWPRAPVDEAVRQLRERRAAGPGGGRRGRARPRRRADAGAWAGRPPGCSETRHGACRRRLALADDVVTVPIYGRAESLNLAAAAAVCLYASARAQRVVRSAAGNPLLSALWREEARSGTAQDTDGRVVACRVHDGHRRPARRPRRGRRTRPRARRQPRPPPGSPACTAGRRVGRDMRDALPLARPRRPRLVDVHSTRTAACAPAPASPERSLHLPGGQELLVTAGYVREPERCGDGRAGW